MGEFLDSSYPAYMNKNVSSENETCWNGFNLLNNFNIKTVHVYIHTDTDKNAVL